MKPLTAAELAEWKAAIAAKEALWIAHLNAPTAESAAQAQANSMAFGVDAGRFLPRLLAYVEAVQPVVKACADDGTVWDCENGACNLCDCLERDREGRGDYEGGRFLPHKPDCPVLLARTLLLEEG